ncbi:MAG: hypothetical protein VX278_23410, partial [Myxococcota bacterium]|nr:hypothetical protein [Myxococcota bacterium]
PLVRQIDVRPLFAKVDPSNPLYEAPHTHPPDFIWGFGSISDFWATLLFLWRQSRLPPPENYDQAFSTYEQTYYYWLFWILLAFVGGGILLWKRKKTLLWTMLPTVPFLLSFWKVPSMVEPHIRFFSQGFSGVVILIALGIYIAEENLSWINRKLIFTLSGFLVALSLLIPIEWPVSRVIVNTHLASALPEHNDSIRALPNQYGRQIHLFVLPLTDRERRLSRRWGMYCERRLKKDGVPLPFFEPSPKQ